MRAGGVLGREEREEEDRRAPVDRAEVDPLRRAAEARDEAGEPRDLCSGQMRKCLPSGPIELGVFEPKDGKLTLRAEVVGSNTNAVGTRTFFGLDAVVLGPAK